MRLMATPGNPLSALLFKFLVDCLRWCGLNRKMQRSKDASSELDFIHFWKPFVRFFQFFCLSHYGIFRPGLKDQRFKLTLLRIFLIVHVSILVASAYFFFRIKVSFSLGMDKYNVSPIFSYVDIGTRFIQTAFFLFIPIEMFCMRRTELKIFETLQCIDDILRKLNHYIDYGIHRRRQWRETLLFFTGMALVVISSLCAILTAINLETILSILNFFHIFIVTRLRVFQFGFFINALCNLLGELKILMLRQQHRIKYNSASWKDIQCARKIYSRVWLLKTLIGDYFGYSMILFVVDSAWQLINSAYWIYLNSDSIESNFLYIRK